MLRKLMWTGMLLTICVWTSGCGIPATPIDLIKPPTSEMNSQMNNFNRRITSMLPDGSRLLIPEQSKGDSGILFGDVDGDGVDEALVVYEENSLNERTLKAALLKQQNEDWQIIWDANGFGYGINYMGVKDLNGDGRQDILLGWSFGAGGNGIDIYRWNNDTLQLWDKKEYDSHLDLNTIEENPNL